MCLRRLTQSHLFTLVLPTPAAFLARSYAKEVAAELSDADLIRLMRLPPDTKLSEVNVNEVMQRLFGVGTSGSSPFGIDDADLGMHAHTCSIMSTRAMRTLIRRNKKKFGPRGSSDLLLECFLLRNMRKIAFSILSCLRPIVCSYCHCAFESTLTEQAASASSAPRPQQSAAANDSDSLLAAAAPPSLTLPRMAAPTSIGGQNTRAKSAEAVAEAAEYEASQVSCTDGRQP
jgi:hypothetical protein